MGKTEEFEEDIEKEDASHLPEGRVNDVQAQLCKVMGNSACSSSEPRDAQISDRPVQRKKCRRPRRGRTSTNASASLHVDLTERDDVVSTNSTSVSRSAVECFEG